MGPATRAIGLVDAFGGCQRYEGHVEADDVLIARCQESAGVRLRLVFVKGGPVTKWDA